MKNQLKATAPKTATSLEATLQNYVNYYSCRVNENQAKFAENVVYYFSWLGEEIYKESYLISYYNSMLNDLLTESEDNVLEYTIANLKQYCKSSYNVRENSSGSLHREVSTWKFQCNLELIDQLEKFIKSNK